MNGIDSQLLQNITDTFYAVTSWGKQAKTEERSLRKPRIGLQPTFRYLLFLVSGVTGVLNCDFLTHNPQMKSATIAIISDKFLNTKRSHAQCNHSAVASC